MLRSDSVTWAVSCRLYILSSPSPKRSSVKWGLNMVGRIKMFCDKLDLVSLPFQTYVRKRPYQIPINMKKVQTEFIANNEISDVQTCVCKNHIVYRVHQYRCLKHWDYGGCSNFWNGILLSQCTMIFHLETGCLFTSDAEMGPAPLNSTVNSVSVSVELRSSKLKSRLTIKFYS